VLDNHLIDMQDDQQDDDQQVINRGAFNEDSGLLPPVDGAFSAEGGMDDEQRR
jgi:hypothetical protein